MRTLILNKGNIVEGTNNSVLEYTFIGGNVSLVRGQKVALATLQMYYSTFNITALYNNNVFNYIWVDGTSHQVVFPDGFYDATGINNYLHFIMVQNGHYLENTATGEFVYFITLTANPTQYAIEVNTFVLNTTIATTNGWTLPANATWAIPTTQEISPMLQILQNDFRDVIGFAAGFYPQGAPSFSQAVIDDTNAPAYTQLPSYTSTQTFLSSSTPQITPLSSYILNCSLINNNYAVPNSLLYSFSPKGTFGNQFSIDPNEYIFIDVLPAQYNKFQISFTDQNLKPVSIIDPNMIIQLLITDPEDDNDTSKMLKSIREMFSDFGQVRLRG